ncbi:hypothetical protein A7K99_05850 [Tatumella citrea]|uniref:Uncharacterized protein n=1 Tax=Tatumella citrea TaxID=53336 RepID=A0A1Y0L5Q6_TATCI|nr:hypothetical protein A7K98_05850 [Tatumella citrea]ARU97391.1 hypothetical protein A7K99_05850 [Tatumella citrea]
MLIFQGPAISRFRLLLCSKLIYLYISEWDPMIKDLFIIVCLSVVLSLLFFRDCLLSYFRPVLFFHWWYSSAVFI